MKLKSLRPKKAEKSDEVSVGYRPKPTFNKATFLLVFAVLLSAASFYEGTAYQKNADSNSISPVAANNAASGQGNASSNGSNTQTGSFVRNHIVGQVAAISNSSITVQNQRTGEDTTLTINSSTQISTGGQSISTSNIQPGDLAIVTKTSSNSNIASKIIVAPGSWSGGSSDTTGQSNTSQSDTIAPLDSN
jgi:hypothetical protein